MIADRDSLIVAAMSAAMFLGVSFVFGWFGWLTWVIAALLFFGGYAAKVGRDDPPPANFTDSPQDGATDSTTDDSQERSTGKQRRGRKRKPGGSIYGPPE